MKMYIINNDDQDILSVFQEGQTRPIKDSDSDLCIEENDFVNSDIRATNPRVSSYQLLNNLLLLEFAQICI